MPPKPTKLAALMSAAGLGLALPGVALADGASPDGGAAEQACLSSAAALENGPLDASGGAAADGATQAAAATPSADDADRDEVLRAVALILIAEPDTGKPAVAAASMPADDRVAPTVQGLQAGPVLVVKAVRVQPTSVTVADEPRSAAAAPAGEPFATGVEAADAASETSPPPTTDRVLASLAEVLRVQPTGDADAAPPREAEPATGESSAMHAAADVEAAGPGAAESTAAETRPAEGLAAEPLATETAAAPKAAPTKSSATHREPPVVAPVVTERAPRYRESVDRLMGADRIVVVSNADKVLGDLSKVRAGQGLATDPDGDKLVVSHEDKVLETLALVRSPRVGPSGPESNPRTPAARRSPAAAPVADQPVVHHQDKVLQTLALVRSAPSGQSIDSQDIAHPAANETQGPNEPAAGTAAPGPNPLGGERVAASELEGVRGGFVTDTGLKVSFGIERAVYINGDLVTTTSLNVADLSRASAGAAMAAAGVEPAAGSWKLVQSGTGNTFLPGTLSSSAVGTAIQNTLDNQKIQTITHINAAVNSAGIMRSLNLQSSMRSAIVDSLRR